MDKKKLVAIIIAALAVICGVVIYFVVRDKKPEPIPLPEPQPVVEEPAPTPQELNSQNFDFLLEDIVASIVYTSGFSAESYITGERYAYGFNNTVVGKRLVKEDETTIPRQAYETTVDHLKTHVKPFLSHINRELNQGEIVALALFMYNVGGERFTGYSEEGKEVCKPSKLFMAINGNESPENCARLFTGFRSAGGMTNDGLLKLRWLQAALYLEVVTPTDLRAANATGIFGMSVADLFEHEYPEKDGYYTPKFDTETIGKVMKQKGIGKTTDELLEF